MLLADARSRAGSVESVFGVPQRVVFSRFLGGGQLALAVDVRADGFYPARVDVEIGARYAPSR